MVQYKTDLQRKKLDCAVHCLDIADCENITERRALNVGTPDSLKTCFRHAIRESSFLDERLLKVIASN